jgi:hypothetical protein
MVRAAPVFVPQHTFADDASTLAARSLAKDDRKRVAEYRLRKPDLKQRMATTEDLYSASSAFTPESVGRYLSFDPEFIPRNLRRGVAVEGEKTGNYWMFREETAQAIGDISECQNQYFSPPVQSPTEDYPKDTENLFFIHGLKGVGKTIGLTQIACHFKAEKWIVVANTGYDVMRDMDGLVRQSEDPERAHIFEQSLKARAFLEDIAITHAEQLKLINLPNPDAYSLWDWENSSDPRANLLKPGEDDINRFPMPAKDALPRPPTLSDAKTLYDLALLGAWRADISAAVYHNFMNELKSQYQVPVLICLDEVNQLEQQSEMWDPRDPFKRVMTRDLSFGNMYAEAIDCPPRRGATVIASTTGLTALKMQEYLERAKHNYRYLAYTNMEIQSALEHYSVSKFLLVPMDIELLRRCEAMTGNVPREVFRFCAPQ